MLAPFRKPKTDCGVNIDGANSNNETLGALFLDDAVDVNGLLNGNTSCRLTHVAEISVTGDDLTTACNAVSVYHPPGLSQLFRQIELDILRSKGFIINPIFDEITFEMNNPLITRALVSDVKVGIILNIKKCKLDDTVVRPWKHQNTINEN